ncbi:MAG: glycoside hydrolase family 95 protein [Planctomycetes bacterium]|nr:glycoside hydrolase family 95 protein [Planctomycetota bacterium]
MNYRLLLLASSGVIGLAAVLLFITPGYAAGREGDLTLWYGAPADEGKWSSQALPIGNGNLGAMIFGGVSKEHIQFNEDSLWIGDETDTGAYQAFGDVYVEMNHPNPQQYRRELDISRAVHTITYEAGGVAYKREYFSSYPAGVMVFRFTANKKGAYTATVSLTDMHEAAIAAEGNRLTASKGSLAGYAYKKKQGAQDYKILLDFESQVLVLHEGGRLSAQGNKIGLDGADAFTLLVCADTNYLNRRDKGWKGEHPHNRITAKLDAAAKKSFDELLKEHVEDYRALFDRFRLDVGKTPEERLRMPTEARLAAYKGSKGDPGLEMLVCQYARYLMISCSRPGSLPANLQGLWNNSVSPPWRSDYHSDVNLEMNYWFVDMTNLSECFEPFAEWLNSIREVRREETQKQFNRRGWINHAENGVFGGSTWKWSKGDAAWLAQNCWDHYRFTLDRNFAENRAYPLLKELCEFWEDELKALPDGKLVSPNGFSPEHGPTEDGVSFDQELIWDLFTSTIEASERLGVDGAFRQKVASLRERLLGPQIGKWGQLQEWMVDRDDPKDTHRHLSHMIAVHPGRQISPLTTPKLAEAARVSMNARGDGATGWSKAWKINIWARLHDGNRAYKLLSEMLQGNFAANLYDFCPPFQIDGNFGYASGVCEMLVQSHLGEIHLLPALPQSWPDGYVKGICARGGFELDIHWEKGQLTQALIRSKQGGTCKVRLAAPAAVTSQGKAVAASSAAEKVIAFETQKGQEYLITPGRG